MAPFYVAGTLLPSPPTTIRSLVWGSTNKEQYTDHVSGGYRSRDPVRGELARDHVGELYVSRFSRALGQVAETGDGKGGLGRALANGRVDSR